ncbi:MAG: polysaccharide deacetylase family protein [Bacteroidales bacterium]|jgi:peptidoglycan/xylan/chitin deacetylase (PgdA/CDA1 family)|nr:polysaccharide deacetylase family protein [Bacteroidales bacterium]
MKQHFGFHLIILLFIINLSDLTYGQLSVAITIDDVPNTGKCQQDNFKSTLLLHKLDSLNIPVTIFITEGLVYKGDSVVKNFELLNNWINRSYTTIGYHSSKHSRYSDVGLDSFKIDVEKGSSLLRELALKYGKSIDYFRLPYNDLGKDSVQHVNIIRYLSSKKYKIAPFTVESADWMFNYIYEYYLEKKDSIKANEIAGNYIAKTLEYFDFFDSLALKIYGRPINQIYLCHDSRLNADYLPVLLNELKKKKYKVISFDEALQDNAYKQEDKYYKKWGISWVYRWMKNQEEISFYNKPEPKDDLYDLYKKLVEEQKKKGSSR